MRQYSKFWIMMIIFPGLPLSLIGQTVQNSGTTNTLRSVCFIDENTGWIISDECTVHKTVDGGVNWETQSNELFNTVYEMVDIQFVNKNYGWIVYNDGEGYDAPTSLLKTTDAGNTWEKIDSIGTYTRESIFDKTSVQFKSDTVGYMIRPGNIVKTTDGGYTWQEKIDLSDTGPMFFLNENTGWMVGFHDEFIIQTTDGGETWHYKNRQILPYSMHSSSIFFVDATTGWFTHYETVLRTADAGLTWAEFELCFPLEYGNHQVREIKFLDSNIGAAVKTDALFKTSDGGESWELLYDGDPVMDIHLVDYTKCWAVGANGLILSFEVDSPTSVEYNNNSRQRIPDKIQLMQNYPNPFNPVTTIQFSLQKSGHVSLKILNLLGQEVVTLVDEIRSAGEHQVQWQADGLPGGIYLARLQTGNALKTVKLVLQK